MQLRPATLQDSIAIRRLGSNTRAIRDYEIASGLMDAAFTDENSLIDRQAYLPLAVIGTIVTAGALSPAAAAAAEGASIAAPAFSPVIAAEAPATATALEAGFSATALPESVSFVGPATGTVEVAGVQASGAVTAAAAGAGAPEVIGIATAGGPFISTLTGLPLDPLPPIEPPSTLPPQLPSEAKALATAAKAIFAKLTGAKASAGAQAPAVATNTNPAPQDISLAQLLLTLGAVFAITR